MTHEYEDKVVMGLRPTGASPEIIKMFSDIAHNIKTPFNRMKERGRPFYEILRKNKENKSTDMSNCLEK